MSSLALKACCPRCKRTEYRIVSCLDCKEVMTLEIEGKTLKEELYSMIWTLKNASLSPLALKELSKAPDPEKCKDELASALADLASVYGALSP